MRNVILGIKNRKITINGVELEADNFTLDESMAATLLKIHINGDVQSVETVSGDLYVANDVKGSIKTMSGDIECGDVGGSVTTMSGDIACSNVSGGASTQSGDIFQFNKAEPN